MTVSYAGSLSRQLFRWKGSVWKPLWFEFLVFILIYYAIQLFYMFGMSEDSKRDFEQVVKTFSSFIDNLPVEFVLGFFINKVVNRWWKQFKTVSWPENLMILQNACLSGPEFKSARRSVARWTCLVSTLAWSHRSEKLAKRFPTNRHLVNAGLMTEEECEMYEDYKTTYAKWWLPTLWILNKFRECRERGAFHESMYQKLVTEVEEWRKQFQYMLDYDWVPLPLVYTQVVTLATYGYLALCLVGRQLLVGSPHLHFNAPIYFPFVTALQFIFYVGWLKVGEALVDPFGEDDEDFELNWIMNRNIYVSYMMCDTVCDQLPSPTTLDPCPDRPLLYTKVSAENPDRGPEDHLAQFLNITQKQLEQTLLLQ